MFTLKHKGKAACSGIFPTASLAVSWALAFLPDMDVEPIELLVGTDTRTKLVISDGWTWSEEKLTKELRVKH